MKRIIPAFVTLLLSAATVWAQVTQAPVPTAVLIGADWPALLLSIGTLVASLAAAAVSIITVSRQAKTDVKVDNVQMKTAQIETSVNSKETAAIGREKALVDAAIAREKALSEQNQLLRDQIEDHRRSAALLAQASAIHDLRQSQATKSLENIDTQTKAIEQNTASTEATVKDMKDAAPSDPAREKRIADALAALEEARKP